MNSESVKLNEDLSLFINRLVFLGDNLEEKVNVSLAISLFVGKQVTLARAAELANRTLADFMAILQKINIPWFEYSEYIKNSDDLAIKLILQESGN